MLSAIFGSLEGGTFSRAFSSSSTFSLRLRALRPPDMRWSFFSFPEVGLSAFLAVPLPNCCVFEIPPLFRLRHLEVPAKKCPLRTNGCTVRVFPGEEFFFSFLVVFFLFLIARPDRGRHPPSTSRSAILSRLADTECPLPISLLPKYPGHRLLFFPKRAIACGSCYFFSGCHVFSCSAERHLLSLPSSSHATITLTFSRRRSEPLFFSPCLADPLHVISTVPWQ